MKRPLFIISLIITAIVYLYLEFFLSDYIIDYSKEDGSAEQIVGIVDRKEYRVDYLGELSPVIYIIPVENKEKLGKNKYIQCYMSKEDYEEPKIGEYILIKGKLKSFSGGRNPGEFDARLYYSSLKIAYRIKNAQIVKRAGKANFFYERLYVTRCYLERRLDSCLNSRDSSVMKAVLLGDKAFMDDEIKNLYKSAGIIHILAVSGLHISILGMGIYKLLKKLRLHVAIRTLVPIILMYVYGQMCGMSTSAARAIVMFSLSLIAKMIGRTYDLLSALSLVELMLLLEQPLYLYNSGFLFSFGAVLGIGFIMPSIYKFIPEKENTRLKFADDKSEGVLNRIGIYIKSGVISGISILIATLPVYMSFFYVYSIQSIALNLLILPLMAPLMILGVVTLILSMIFNGGQLSGFLIHLILKWYELLCTSFSGFSAGKLYLGHAAGWKIFIYVALLIIFEIIMDKWRGKKGRITGFAVLLISILILIYNPRPELSMTFLDVGQGDGIVIRTRQGNFLIDGGSTDKKEIGKYTIIPYLQYEGIGSLDAVLVTHEDEDHISGIFEIMDDMENGDIKIKNLILPDISDSSKGENYKKLEERAKNLGIPVRYISCGQSLFLKDLELKCLNPKKNMSSDSANAGSVVLYLRHESFTALFTGDVEEEGQIHLVKDIRDNPDVFQNLTLLKVAHHGSKYTTDNEFLDLLNPKVAIISCGIDNKYGHPHEELLDRLFARKTNVYRTDEGGAITVNFSADRVKISEYLKDK